MSRGRRPAPRDLARVADSIEEALASLGAPAPREGSERRVANPRALLGECIDLCDRLAAANDEPVRSLHHLACTGGSLISKCLAAMPNTQLMSEVDPLSPFPLKADKPLFLPRDMGTLLLQSTRGTSPEFLATMFLDNLAAIHADTVGNGLRLVVRDHAHGHFCVGAAIPERPTLRALISSRLPVLSAVTVRHPVDSFLSLREARWLDFSPPTFDEYCARCLAFLAAYEGLPVVRYEDFVAGPQEAMMRLCDALRLPYVEQFTELYDVFRVTGDSGRSGSTIGARPRRAVDAALAREIGQSGNCRVLLERLGYANNTGGMS